MKLLYRSWTARKMNAADAEFIRLFDVSDLPRLKEITVEAFDGVSIDQAIEQDFGVINDRNWKWRKGRHLDADLAREGVEIWVAAVGGEIAGFVTLWLDAAAGIGNVSNLALTAKFRGRGLGRRLVLHALDRLRAAGMSHARIETVVQNTIGIGLYTDLGFQAVAQQIHFVKKL
jgi:ribosomal protein S18 acetylase RimI-like enzyme